MKASECGSILELFFHATLAGNCLACIRNWYFGILLLMPLVASLYQGYVFETFHSSYTDYTLYLDEWPLLGGVLLGRILVVGGIGLAIWKRFGMNIKRIVKDY